MSPIIDNVYGIEYWNGKELFSFRAKCICEQPLKNGLYLFEAEDGYEIEVDARDIVREYSRELV